MVPQQNMVVEGEEGWCFLTNDSNQVLEQLAGNNTLDEGKLALWEKTFLARKEYFEKRGLCFYHFVVPDKEFIYQKFLPSKYYVDTSGKRPIEKLKLLANKCHINNFDYISDLMLDNINVKDLYRKLDSHWGYKGSYLAYVNALDKIGLSNLALKMEDLVTYETEADGDLGSKMNPPKKEITTVLAPKQRDAIKVYDNEIVNIAHIQLFRKNDPNLPRAILFHDSFSNWNIQFFAENFSELICIHHQKIDYDLIEKFNPNFVILETVERFLIDPVSDDTDESLTEVLARKNSSIDALMEFSSEWEKFTT